MKKATQTDAWSGVSPGDVLYKGNYHLNLLRTGTKPMVIYTGFQYKNYTYNLTRRMIYTIPFKYKSQPDLFAVAETGSSNWENVDLFYIQNGKLKKMSESNFYKSFGYTLRPMNIGKNKFRTAVYNNAARKWDVTDYAFDYNKGSLTQVQKKSYPYENTVTKNWRKDWR
ncbi:hypothetical protein [Bacillus sp. V5-8f]|uniref:hypothetical protein n=1 Tax=Bacillus sp. V5-8f TaxID=2053044 RepID=UPI000C75CF7D|nr:hypothetical protein [Bacillus sp. V5-8f]PLT33309.1 hypothetical protein CUU64_13460 [Bacillus sp. V5-8f]